MIYIQRTNSGKILLRDIGHEVNLVSYGLFSHVHNGPGYKYVRLFLTGLPEPVR